MEKENMFINIRDGLNSKPLLVPSTTKLEEVIKNTGRDWYRSLYIYNDSHKKILEEKNTLAGITDTVTNKLFFDFDSKDNLELARTDTVETANRLVSKGFPEESIQCYFTGSKGFNIEVDINEYITPEKFGLIVDEISGDLPTFDKVVREANRIVRISGTKHQTTGLYKIPLTGEELVSMDIEEIKTMAKKRRVLDIEHTVVTLPEELKILKPVEKKLDQVKTEMSFDTSTIDMKERPKGLDEARWLLSNGFFKAGERNPAMLCLAATYHNQKFPYEVTRGILEGVADIQSARTGDDVFEGREIDLILKQVYGANWRGGMFTTRDPNNWLAKYAMRMKINVKDDEGPQTLDGIESGFMSYVNNIEKNTIKTGIDELDRIMPITIGSNIGVVAAAGAGKTALALNILKHNSEQGILTVFCSLDMNRLRLFEKVLYNITGLSRDDLYATFKRGEGKQLTEMVKKHYGNVWFYDRSSASISDIKNYVMEVEQKTGAKVKMVMIDYLERVNSDISDDTASSKKVAGEIQDLVNDLQVAAITLCQPNKFSLGGGPDTEIKSYTSIKGSSFLYQSFRGIISLSRPFYTPSTKDLDKYMIINVLKNDLGEQARLELGWSGKRGNIYPLEDIEKQELHDLMKMKESSNKEKESGGWS